MKKLSLFAIALLFSAVSFAALNPFAYALSSHLSLDQKTLTVNYSLNADATSVRIIIGNDAKEVECTGSNLQKGSHSVEISTEGIPTASPQSWRVVVEGNSVSAPTLQDTQFGFCLPRGVDVDNSPESPYFGRIYATEATAGGNAYHSKEGKGLYAFDPTLTPIQNATGGYVFTGGITYGKDDISRVVVAGDGRVFVSRFSPTDVSPVVEVNPADLNEDFKDVFTAIKGKTIGIDVKGAGEDLQLVMLSTDERIITEYDLGTATTWTETTPSRTYVKKDLTTEKSLSLVTDNAYISYDLNDGIWLTQHRATATTTEPTIAHVIASGVDYNNFNEGIEHNGTSNGGVAISPDGSLLAVVGAGAQKLTIYAVSRDGSGKITLTSQYTIATSGSNHTALSWDYAGNLYVTNRSAETLTFYAMPYGGTVSTPAASKYAFTLQEGGVEGTFYAVEVNHDENMGKVEGKGNYLEGTTATLTATPNTGYEFISWTIDGDTYTENPLTLNVDRDVFVTANFEALKYTVNAIANNDEYGSVTGSGLYDYNTTIELFATENDGYEFVNWSNGSTENPLNVIVTKEEEITANFRMSLPASINLNPLHVQDYSGEIVGKIKRVVQKGANIIVLSHDDEKTPYIYSIDHATNTITKISTDGVEPAAEGFISISDIAVTEDGKLVACNYVHCTFTASNTSYFYIWNDLASDPTVWFTSQKSGNFNDAYMGYTMAVNGTSTNAQVTISAFNKSNANTRFSHLEVVDGIYTDADYKYSRNIAQLNNDVIGAETYQLNASPLAKGKWVVDGDLSSPIEFVAENGVAISTYTALDADLLGKKYSGASYLKNHDDHHLMIAPYADSEGFLAGVKILGITDGFNNAKEITTYTEISPAVDATTAAATAFVDNEGYLTIYLLADKQVHAFTQRAQGTGTALENATVASQTHKVIRNGQVLIIRDGKTFNMMGQEIK